MKFKHDFSYLFRKYYFIRLLCILAVMLIIIGFSSIVSYSIKEKPVILSVSQQVGSPGDIISIRGKFFNQNKDSSYVEIAGNRLTESSYISWNDDEIVISIPANTKDGLMYVVSKSGKSNPDFFANKSDIPVSISQNSIYTNPIITAVSFESLEIGGLLGISGKNFGNNKNSSNVWFSTKKTSQQITENELKSNNYNDDSTEYIHASNANFDYEYWSDNLIRVYVPDGASSGYLYVETENGKSTKHAFNVTQTGGTKKYGTKTIFLVQTSADVSNIKGTKDSIVSLRLPIPQTTAEQPTVTMTESTPKPLIDNYNGTSVFHITMNKIGKDSYAADEKYRITQNHVITVKSVETNIDVNRIKIPTDRSKMIYKVYTRKDELIPADVPALVKLLPSIIYKSINPYRQAKLIYEYMMNNYEIQNKLRKTNTEPLDMLTSKKGDAYDFAVLYAALLRTAGVPAKLMSGILVDENKNTRPHWWVNFYLENFGWVPIDPALGAGLDFTPFQTIENPREYYFGNLDSQHITFSQNYNKVKSTITNGKTVYIPKTYATQSIWEESSNDISSYSSFWNVPTVLGIY